MSKKNSYGSRSLFVKESKKNLSSNENSPAVIVLKFIHETPNFNAFLAD